MSLELPLLQLQVSKTGRICIWSVADADLVAVEMYLRRDGGIGFRKSSSVQVVRPTGR